MTTLLQVANAFTCGLVALAMLFAILDPRVHDGIIIKCGLGSMMLGFGSIALRMMDGLGPDDAIGLARSTMLVSLGIAVVILGYLWRTRKARHPVRRTSDWTELDTQPMDWPEIRS